MSNVSRKILNRISHTLYRFTAFSTTRMDVSPTLKVGLYNCIPDIGKDNLKSYSDFINKKWNEDVKNAACKLELIVDGKTYDPYGDLTKYLGSEDDCFDLIEVDMARAKELKGLVTEISGGSEDGNETINTPRYFNASLDAVKIGDKYLGFPTFACGNFIIELKHGDEQIKLLDGDSYTDFVTSLQKAKQAMIHDIVNKGGYDSLGMPHKQEQHIRLLGGKVDSSDGYHLPYLYLDAIVNIEGKDSIDAAVQQVLRGNVNTTAIERLKEFVTYFEDSKGRKDKGGDTIERNVVDGEDCYFFGYSEKLAKILEDGRDIVASGVLSVPFGTHNHNLIYTDGIVINKRRYEVASTAKKNAIWKFAKFLASDEIRSDIVMGKDLNPPEIRYLLPPIKSFYKNVSDAIYKVYLPLMLNGVNAPSLTANERVEMEKILKPMIFK